MGDDAFIKHFKDHLGAYYLEKHEAHLRHFFKTVRAQIPSILARTDKAREAFTERPT